MAVSGAIAATSVQAGYPASLAALAANLICGLWNGVLVAVLQMQPIVATLVLMVMGRGIAQLINKGAIVTFDDPWLGYLGTGTFLGLPIAPLIMAGLAVLAILAVPRSALGLFIEAVGINPFAAWLAGLQSNLVLLLVYGFSGLCAGIAGMLIAADIRAADAKNAGLWLEPDAILAVVIGGTLLQGGRFSSMLSMLGAMIIQAINTGILVMGLPLEFNLIVKAAVMRFTGLLSARVLGDLLTDNALLGITAVGGIDLSVGAVIGFTGALVAVLIQGSGLHRLLALAIALVAAAACGAAMGCMIHYLELPACIVTMAGLFLACSATSILTQQSVSIPHPFCARTSDLYFRLPGGGRITAIGGVMVAVFAVGTVLAHRTWFGANVDALARNATSASLMVV